MLQHRPHKMAEDNAPSAAILTAKDLGLEDLEEDAEEETLDGRPECPATDVHTEA